MNNGLPTSALGTYPGVRGVQELGFQVPNAASYRGDMGVRCQCSRPVHVGTRGLARINVIH